MTNSSYKFSSDIKYQSKFNSLLFLYLYINAHYNHLYLNVYIICIHFKYN